MTRCERISEVLNNLPEEKIIDIYNDYCDKNNDWDSQVYPMEEFDEIMAGYVPSDLLASVSDDFSLFHKYFMFDGYGRAASFPYLADSNSRICLEDIARYIDRTEDYFGNWDIQDALEEE